MTLKNIIKNLVFLSLLFLLCGLVLPAESLAQNDYGLSATAGSAQLPSSIKGQTSVVGVIGVVVKLLLSFTGMFFLGLMLYAGITWMKSMGSGDEVTRAKEIIQSAIIGLIIVSAAYAITSFVFTSLSATSTANSSSNSVSGNAQNQCATKHPGGVCKNTANCQAPSTTESGLCPGAANIQCCY